MAGYETFSRCVASGRHPLQSVLPHGSVTGSLKGLEHCAHCTRPTSFLASFEAFNGSMGDVLVGEEEEVEELRLFVRTGKEEEATVLEDIQKWWPALRLGLLLQRRYFSQCCARYLGSDPVCVYVCCCMYNTKLGEFAVFAG